MHMCEIIFLIAVTMCDLVHTVETIVYHPGLIFQKKRFSGAASSRNMSSTISILYTR